MRRTAPGWPGLVTNNHKMMQNPYELAALLLTRLTMFVMGAAPPEL